MNTKTPEETEIADTIASFERIEPTLQSPWVGRSGPNGERLTWMLGKWHHTKERGSKPYPITREQAASLWFSIPR